MLHSLSISNYILIGSLETSFPEGLVIISGETGAGKSILLGALSLVLGAKADASMVGPLSDHCVVEAVFGVDETVKAILAEADIPADDNRLVLRRTVALSGRSRSFANDEPVSVNVLQALSARLVDIHSQHQTLKLQDARFRMEALDLQAGGTELRSRCATAWNRLQKASRALEDIRDKKKRALQEQEYNLSRFNRLEEAKLVPGEVESLEEEEKQLAHAEEIKETLCALESLLGSDEGSPSLLLREAGKLLGKASRFLPSLETLEERVTSARLELEDIAQEIETVNSRMEASPERLEQVQERLSLLYSLMQKHGASSLEELIAERDRLESLVADASSLEREEERAAAECREALKAHEALCQELHLIRAEAAAPLAAAVQDQLRFLLLDHAVFQVELTPSEPGPNGMDEVNFLFSASGKQPSDVAKAASGGELSRIMLSLKAVMAGYAKLPTLVFDEIDTGVSGSAADKMGQLIGLMGGHMQVFAITHLPQVAAKGSAHYLVSKTEDVTSMRLLRPEERVLEVARMLSGSTISPAAMANARTLLNT